MVFFTACCPQQGRTEVLLIFVVVDVQYEVLLNLILGQGSNMNYYLPIFKIAYRNFIDYNEVLIG